jgi:rhodanese-related sulfurtransferase
MENLNQNDWVEGLKASENAKIIDVRTPAEFESGYIEDAQLINIQDSSHFMNEIEKLDKDTEYYVYCRSGRRSEMACQLMDKVGIKSAYNLEGGILEWKGEIKH